MRPTRLIRRALGATVLICMTLAGSAIASEPFDPATAEFVPGEILVRFTPGAARAEIAQEKRARPRNELAAARVWVLEVDEGDELDAVARFRNNPNIEFAEPNYIYSVVPCATGDCTPPTDLLFDAKWDLHNTGYVRNTAGEVVASTGMAGADVSWLEAFHYLQSQGGPAGGAVLGVIDTGVRATHQDLAGKVIGGRNFCPSLLCLIGTINANAWADDNGHGTHVATTAAGHGNNGLGVPGIAYSEDVKILAIRVCGGPLGLCNAAGITNGIIWAVDNGADVLNLSLGGGAPSAATQNALQYALDNNVLPVCASGNDGAETVSYPAAFPQCMAVASSNWSDERSSYSNAGPEIEVAAPGGDLSDSQPHSLILAGYHTADAAYAYLAGTSMATPQVAGLATLLRANGLETVDQVRTRIRESADDIGPPGFDNATGFGRINVYRALTQRDPLIQMAIGSRSQVNLRANGVMQVTMHAVEAQTFDLTMIDPHSIRIGDTPLARDANGQPRAQFTGEDGAARLVMHFSVRELRENGSLGESSTEFELVGELSDGRIVRATAPVTVL